MFQLVDNLTHQAGAHALRAGVDFIFNDDTITYPRSSRGSYAFSSMANFLAGNYSGFTQTFGDPVVSQSNPNVGVYAQDEWRARPGLTLNLGLRYDLQFLDAVSTDTNNVSPRVGFAWTPSPASDLVIRGSAGLFFDRVPLRAVANAILSAGNTTDLSQLQQPSVSNLIPAQAGAPAFPDILPARVLTTTLVDFTTMDPHLQNAYSTQAGVEAGAVTWPWTHRQRRLPVRARREPADVREPERADLRGGGHEQRLPARLDLSQQQPVLVGRHVHVSRACTRRSCSARATGRACG